ncbi:MAG: DNA polymerase III subunit delta' [Rickettsiales bacterium]
MTEKITPRTNTKLFGHEKAEAMLLHEFLVGKLAHGLIFSGARGIGKATLAYRFARFLLSGRNDMNLPPEDPIFHRIVANSHSDLLVIELTYDHKKEEFANEISVEQSRTIAQTLSLTPAEGQWRVVIIDSANNLNNNSANAILKILEEPPPQTILMLIAHNAGKLLPTIRSRCRIISLKPLSQEDFSCAMRLVEPEIDSQELVELGVISANSVGIALELREQGAITRYNEILELFASASHIDNKRTLKFCEQIGTGKKSHGNWQLFTHITLCILERVTKRASGAYIAPTSAEEGALLDKMATIHSAEIWAEKWQEASNQFSLAKSLHLDYKQVALTFFHSLASAEEFTLV